MMLSRPGQGADAIQFAAEAVAQKPGQRFARALRTT